jgi:hypothetical protein
LAYLIGQTVKSDINSKLEDSLSLHFMWVYFMWKLSLKIHKSIYDQP